MDPIIGDIVLCLPRPTSDWPEGPYAGLVVALSSDAGDNLIMITPFPSGPDAAPPTPMAFDRQPSTPGTSGGWWPRS